MYDYEVVAIGAGSGGCASMMRSVDNGKKKVALIEYRKGGTGGTCVSRGCIPTKALLRSAEAYAEVKNAPKLGIIVDGARPDMKAIQKGKQQVVNSLKFGLDNFLLKSRGVERILGKARLIDPHTIELTDGDKTWRITSENIIIATGSEAIRIPAFNIDGKKILTSDEVLNLSELPESMLIAGAGVVGIEIAYLFAMLDVNVTVVDLAPQVLPLIHDKDVTDAVQKSLEKNGIKFHLGIGIDEMHVSDEGKAVCTLADGTAIEADIGLVAIGRTINVRDLGLEELGIEQGPKGVVLVNEKMQTNIPSIYAVGDITPGPQLSHKAQKQGLTAADNICGIESRINMDVIPSATFVQPEVATVGLTESEATEAGFEVMTSKKGFSSNEKAIAMRETNGFIKVVAEKESHRILGAQIFGPQGSILIEEFSLALEKGLTLEDIALSIHAHPTLSELVMETCKLALGLAFDK